MTEQNLIDLKEQLEYWKIVKGNINNLEKRRQDLNNKKLELEQDPKVKEYLETISDISKNNDILKDYKEANYNWKCTEEQFINKNAHSTETNSIYVCMWGYGKKILSSKFNGVISFSDVIDWSKLLAFDDEKTEYRVYADIEKPHAEKVIIKKRDWKEFEKNNIVLFPSKDNNASDFYDKIRLLFLKTCLQESQDEAIQKILSMRKDD